MGENKVVAAVMDFGQKYFPPPVVLFICHLAYAMLTSIMMIINAALEKGGSCWVDGWTTYVEW